MSERLFQFVRPQPEESMAPQPVEGLSFLAVHHAAVLEGWKLQSTHHTQKSDEMRQLMGKWADVTGNEPEQMLKNPQFDPTQAWVWTLMHAPAYRATVLLQEDPENTDPHDVFIAAAIVQAGENAKSQVGNEVFQKLLQLDVKTRIQTLHTMQLTQEFGQAA